VFCSLLGYRPPPKREPGGAKARVEALQARGVTGDLWRRTLDELDACAAAFAARSLAEGFGGWVGDPDEGIIVLPVERLADVYAPLPRPERVALA
jgi:hypothetical protein